MWVCHCGGYKTQYTLLTAGTFSREVWICNKCHQYETIDSPSITEIPKTLKESLMDTSPC